MRDLPVPQHPLFFSPPPAQRWARIIVPSTHHSSLSIWPASANAAWSRRRISSTVPWAFHLSNNLHTVCHGPNSSGRSRQGELVLKIQRMPSTIVRGSRGGRPVAAGFGNTSLIKSHSSSLSNRRAILAAFRVCEPGGVTRLCHKSCSQNLLLRQSLGLQPNLQHRLAPRKPTFSP